MRRGATRPSPILRDPVEEEVVVGGVERADVDQDVAEAARQRRPQRRRGALDHRLPSCAVAVLAAQDGHGAQATTMENVELGFHRGLVRRLPDQLGIGAPHAAHQARRVALVGDVERREGLEAEAIVAASRTGERDQLVGADVGRRGTASRPPRHRASLPRARGRRSPCPLLPRHARSRVRASRRASRSRGGTRPWRRTYISAFASAPGCGRDAAAARPCGTSVRASARSRPPWAAATRSSPASA